MLRSTDVSALPPPQNTSKTGRGPSVTLPPAAPSSGSLPPPQFLNESHRDMVLQKQMAVNDFSLPQSSSDTLQDDDKDPGVMEAAARYRAGGGIAASAAAAPDGGYDEEEEADIRDIRDSRSGERSHAPYLEEESDEEEAAEERRRRRSLRSTRRSSAAEEFEDEASDAGGGVRRRREKSKRAAEAVTKSSSSWTEGFGLAALAALAVLIASLLPLDALLRKYIPVVADMPHALLVLRAVAVGAVLLGVQLASQAVKRRDAADKRWRAASGDKNLRGDDEYADEDVLD